MSEISGMLEQHLKTLDFVDYLQFMHDRIEKISHRPKYDTAYYECRELSSHIKYRIVTELKLTWQDFDIKHGRNLRQSEEKLDLYCFSDSDKQKSYRIKEFVDEYTYDLSNFIRAAKKRKENPDSTIEEDEL